MDTYKGDGAGRNTKATKLTCMGGGGLVSPSRKAAVGDAHVSPLPPEGKIVTLRNQNKGGRGGKEGQGCQALTHL